jgi:hypothetical protein
LAFLASLAVQSHFFVAAEGLDKTSAVKRLFNCKELAICPALHKS